MNEHVLQRHVLSYFFRLLKSLNPRRRRIGRGDEYKNVINVTAKSFLGMF
jgi:hypothetical protein